MGSWRHVLALAPMCLLFVSHCLQAQAALPEIQCQQYLDRANWIKNDALPAAQGTSGVASAFRSMQANIATFDALSGPALAGAERQAMIEKVKALTDADRVATITNFMKVEVAKAKPGTYTIALHGNAFQASTIGAAMASFRLFLLAQMRDFLVQAGKKKSDVDPLAEEGVETMFRRTLADKGCKS